MSDPEASEAGVAAAAAAAAAAASSLNQQIADALAQSAAVVGGGAIGRAGAEQLMVLTLTLAMQNAVAQQQQLYMLQNAATTALVKALLESGPDGASRWGEALQLVREAFSAVDVSKTLVRLQQMLEQLTARSAAAAPAAPAAPPAEPGESDAEPGRD
jgi:hypothetical protein